jgi:serine/threonine protein kinase
VALEAGQQLRHYRLIDKIGEGGMGVIWKATDTRLDRDVAIKVLRRQLAGDPRLRERFEREARTISSLNHPHICTLYDIGQQDDVDFIVMEQLEGDVLVDLLKRGALPLQQVFRNGIQIAEALHEAHRAGVIHRDLKPDNIMLTRHGVKLLDFGLATIVGRSSFGVNEDASAATTVDHQLTHEGTLLGTIPYMAPEQLEGNELDARSDIFALGSVLYEMITGRPAFTGKSQARLISAIMTSEPPPLGDLQADAPSSLDHVVRRCLAKQPEERWHSALDVARELEWLSAPAKAEPPGPPAPAPRRTGYRIEYFKSPDGASIAAARGGSGKPLFVVPTMVDTIETSWGIYAGAFPDHELITYDRRGTGLSERGSLPHDPETYLRDAQVVVDGFELGDLDVLGTLLGTTEAAWLAARNEERVKHLVLRAPTLGLGDWSSIPGVRAALAAMDEDWEYFTESFAQFVVGWGNPNAPLMAERFRTITSRQELRVLLEAFKKLDLTVVYDEIQAPTLVEHHPGYFFPDLYSRRIASMIPDCTVEVFAGVDGEFITDLAIAGAFLKGE